MLRHFLLFLVPIVAVSEEVMAAGIHVRTGLGCGVCVCACVACKNQNQNQL